MPFQAVSTDYFFLVSDSRRSARATTAAHVPPLRCAKRCVKRCCVQRYFKNAAALMPGNSETWSAEGDRCLILVTLALKLWMGEAGCDVGLIWECDVDGLELSGLERAVTTEAHSLGCMIERWEWDVEGLELGVLLATESCLFGDEIGDRDGLNALGLDVYSDSVSCICSIDDGKRCILPEKPLTIFLPALASDSNASRIIVIFSSIISPLFCSIRCLAHSATRFPS